MQDTNWLFALIFMKKRFKNVSIFLLVNSLLFGLFGHIFIASAYGDVTPPEVVSFNMTPVFVDVTQQDQTITATIVIRDNESGLCFSSFESCAPISGLVDNDTDMSLDIASLEGNQDVGILTLKSKNGTDNLATYEFTGTMKKGAQIGTWVIKFLKVVDRAGNEVSWYNYTVWNTYGNWNKNVTEIPNATGVEIVNVSPTPQVSTNKTENKAKKHKKKSKKKKSSKKYQIKSSKSVLAGGSVLTQVGSNFTKNGSAKLSLLGPNGNVYATKIVKVNAQGKFSSTIVTKRISGKYSWFALDLTTQKRSNILNYKIK